MKKILTLLAAGIMCVAAFAQDLDAQYAADLLAPGTPAPEITLDDVYGNTVSLSSFQGRSVVLVFWASWCPDCRAEVSRCYICTYNKAKYEKNYSDNCRNGCAGGLQGKRMDKAGKGNDYGSGNGDVCYHGAW